MSQIVIIKIIFNATLIFSQIRKQQFSEEIRQERKKDGFSPSVFTVFFYDFHKKNYYILIYQLPPGTTKPLGT